MAKIIATGTWKGDKMTVEVEDGKVYIDALENDAFDDLIFEQHVIGGTYYAPAKSMENALNTLTHHFFDDEPKIITIGEFEKIPCVNGRVY